MDALDLEILATMGLSPWGPSPGGLESLRAAHIARKLDTTPETVRSRVRAMENAGVIEGYEIHPLLETLGHHGAATVFHVEDPDEKAQVIEDILLVDGVLEVTDYMGPYLLVMIAYETHADLSRRLDLIQRQTGDPEPIRVSADQDAEVPRKLTHLDWRIVRALRGQARRSLQEVGEEVGVSYRTVKRRLDRMAEEGNVLLGPVVEFGRISGILPFGLFFELAPDAPEATKDRLAKLFPDRTLMVRPPELVKPEYFDLMLYAENIQEVEAMRRKAAGLEGLEQVIAILTKQRWQTRWLDDRIDVQVATLARGMAGSGKEAPGS